MFFHVSGAAVAVSHGSIEVNYESSDDAKRCVQELHGMDSWVDSCGSYGHPMGVPMGPIGTYGC